MTLFMNISDVYEIIGFLGAFLVLVSFILKDIKWIRIINVIGAFLFTVYGFSTQTWATAFMNLALIFVHIFYLVKMHLDKKKKEATE